MSKQKSEMDTTTRNVYVNPTLAMHLNKPQKPREYPSRASKYTLRLRRTKSGNVRGTTKPRANS